MTSQHGRWLTDNNSTDSELPAG